MVVSVYIFSFHSASIIWYNSLVALAAGKELPMKERKIRVYNSLRKHGDPSILLQGAWLADAGFAPGDYISVKCQENQLTIQLEKKFVPEADVRSSHR